MRMTRQGRWSVGAVAIAMAALLAGCGGGGSAKQAGGKGVASTPTTVAASGAPAVFKRANAQAQSAITRAEAIITASGSATTLPAGPFASAVTSLRTAQGELKAGGSLPASQDASLLTGSLDALIQDLAAPTIRVAVVTQAIGAYQAAATRYSQDANIS